MTGRVNPLDAINLDDFTSDIAPAHPVDEAALASIAEKTGFVSRPVVHPSQVVMRKQRRYTTGRNVQLNIKVTADVLARFQRAADREAIPQGAFLEKLLDAYQNSRQSESPRPKP